MVPLELALHARSDGSNQRVMIGRRCQRQSNSSWWSTPLPQTRWSN